MNSRLVRIALVLAGATVIALTSDLHRIAAKPHPARVELKKVHDRCTAAFDMKKIEMSKRKDVALWEIDNDRTAPDGTPGKDQCADEEVLLCTYIDNKHSPLLLTNCASTPVNGIALNVPFPIAGRTTHRVMCLGRPEKKTSGQMSVHIGAEASAPCPATAPTPHPDHAAGRPTARTAPERDHVIDIEVLP